MRVRTTKSEIRMKSDARNLKAPGQCFGFLASDAVRTARFVFRHSFRTLSPRVLALVSCGFLQAGCSNNPASTQPSRLSDRQDSMLRDPFGYKPEQKPIDISGGDLGHLDRDALKKDLNNVFNP